MKYDYVLHALDNLNMYVILCRKILHHRDFIILLSLNLIEDMGARNPFCYIFRSFSRRVIEPLYKLLAMRELIEGY